MDIESNTPAKEMVEAVNKRQHQFPGGSSQMGRYYSSTNRTLAEKIGLRIQAAQPFYDLEGNVVYDTHSSSAP